MEELIMQQINSDPFLKLQHELKQFNLDLEFYDDWLGEPAPHKYIVLQGITHIAYAQTLAGVRKALAREKRALKTYSKSKLVEMSQLTIFD